MKRRPVIEVSGLYMSFGKAQILDDVSFSVNRGERLSIIGPNGAGKSTLLKLIVRILTGSHGEISILGKPIKQYSQKELAKILGYVPQVSSGMFPFTVHEFVMMGRYPHLSPFTSVAREDEEAVSWALELTGAQEFADRYIGSLSGGERQKVYIAAALCQGAKVLLLDEPATFLDPKAQGELHETLAKVNRELNATMVYVTHDINAAALWSDNILALNNGRVLFFGKAEDVMTDETLKLVYDKDFTFMSHPKTGKTLVAPDIEQ